MKKIISTTLIIVLLLPILCFSGLAADPDNSYVIGGRGKKQIPLSYTVEKIFTNFGKINSTLSNPQDMYVDSKNHLIYILDSGNGRIVILDFNGDLVDEIIPTGKAELKNPQGLFIDKDGDIFVADTENKRVVHLGTKGQYIEEFVQPDSDLYDTTYPFFPIKIAIDSQGQLYVLNRDDYHGFVKLNAYNEFYGYIASNKVKTNVIDAIIGIFASEQQQSLLGDRTPAVHTNILMMDDDTFYATTARTSENQINHFTPAGINFYLEDEYGDKTPDYITQYFGGSIEEEIYFTDICVDNLGILSVLDETSGRIFQYDQDGSMLTVFGGTGNWNGRFRRASAIDVDDQGLIYILDSAIGNIQVFKPTEFIKTVHKALNLYQNGKYEQAIQPWEEILKTDRGYYVAHLGMGKVYFKQDKWNQSMVRYKTVDEKKLYSEAFNSKRTDFIRDNFFLVFAMPVVLIIVLVLVISKLGKFAKQTQSQSKVNDFRIGLNVMYSPWDGFTFIKKYRKQFSYIGPTIILILWVVFSIALMFLEHYPLADIEPHKRSFLQEITKMIIPFFTWIICLYLVLSIMEGESMIREIYSASCYALLPIVLFTIPMGVLSRIMSAGESGIYNFLWMLIYIWAGVLIVISIQSMNSYKFGQVIVRILVTLFACVLVWCIAGLIYILLNKLVTFVYDIVMQNRMYWFSLN